MIFYDTQIHKEFLTDKKHIHFIGIGGSGMFPLVQIFTAWAITSQAQIITLPRDTIDFEREKMQIPVTIGQRAENIAGADLIIPGGNHG